MFRGRYILLNIINKLKINYWIAKKIVENIDNVRIIDCQCVSKFDTGEIIVKIIYLTNWKLNVL